MIFGLHGGQVLCCGSRDGQLDKKENMVSSAFPLYCYSHRVSDVHIKITLHGELNYMKEELNNQR